MVKYKVKVDKNKCIGCGSCVAICAGNFELIEGKVQEKNAESDLPCNKEAAESCPVQAISVEEVE